MTEKDRNLPAPGDDVEARLSKFRNDLLVRNGSVTLTDIMALDDDAREVAERGGLLAGDRPFHPFDVHHQPGRGRQLMAGDGGRERFSGDSEMRLGRLGGDRSTLRMGGRPVKGDLSDALAGDGTMDQRPRGGRMIMRHHLPGDLGQRTHRLVGDEPGRTTIQDDGGDDAEARS